MRARRYVGGLDRHWLAVLIASALVGLGACYLVAFHLPLRADIADLLPSDAQSVVDLHKLEARLPISDTVLVVVNAPDRETCTATTADLDTALHRISPSLVVRIDGDQAEARAFLWANRFMLAPLPEIQRAHDALEHRINAAKLAANPLFIDLDTPDDATRRAADADAKRQLHDLNTKRTEIEGDLHRPSNRDRSGRRAVLEVRATMPATDVDRGRLLLDALDAARADVASRHPTVGIGFAGDIVTSIAEHDAIERGTLISSLLTTVLVGLVLALYIRSVRLLVLLVGTIGFATIVAFGTAAFTVGHLNAATAFLGAIIAGNGINYGILLIARFLEERRTLDIADALAAAISGTLVPTAIASLGAAIAYGALIATSFTGFSDFAIIGSAGMLLCWVASYTVLPVLVLRFARRTHAVGHGERWLERALVYLLGVRRRRLAGIGALALVAAASAIVAHYLANDPFEYDLRELGSVADASETERGWMKIAEDAFGKGRAGRTYIAAERAEQVPAIVEALAAPERRHAIGQVQSLLDVMPSPQTQRTKRALLGDVRRMLDDPLVEDALGSAEYAELRQLRPTDELPEIVPARLPAAITEALSDKQGRLGYIVSVRPAAEIDELDGHDVIRFAHAVRSLDLGRGETITTSGASVIFADILETIARDGAIVTGLAVAGIALMLLLVLGRDRRAIAVFVSTAAGALVMIATCAVLGIHVNFLDFVALPITLGLGVDYGINVAHRQLGANDPIAMLRSSGGAVFVCSLTTMIGYSSLLVSDNLAIRGFGRASLIGEITTVLAALVLVPLILARDRSRS